MIGSQDDPDALAKAVALLGGEIDLVVDDASHLPGPTAESLKFVWPHLVADGLYFVEDIHVAHQARWLAKTPGDDLVTTRSSFAASLHPAKGESPELVGLMSIEFRWRLCVLRKRT